MNLNELASKYEIEIRSEVAASLNKDEVDGLLQSWISYSDPTTDFFPEVIQNADYDGEIISRIINEVGDEIKPLAAAKYELDLEDTTQDDLFEFMRYEVEEFDIYWNDYVEEIYDVIRDAMSERSIEVFGADVTDFYNTGEGVDLHQELHQLSWIELSDKFNSLGRV